MARLLSSLACGSLVVTLGSASVHACATCYGASDAAMARGMNAGIFVLLTFIGLVLGGIVTAAAVIGLRASRRNRSAPAAEDERLVRFETAPARYQELAGAPPVHLPTGHHVHHCPPPFRGGTRGRTGRRPHDRLSAVDPGS